MEIGEYMDGWVGRKAGSTDQVGLVSLSRE